MYVRFSTNSNGNIRKRDGRFFEDKKADAINYLKNQEDTLLAERLFSSAQNDELGRVLKGKFWQPGERIHASEGIVLRNVHENDKEKYLKLQRETALMKSMLKKRHIVICFGMSSSTEIPDVLHRSRR